jgi:hypothetical protein
MNTGGLSQLVQHFNHWHPRKYGWSARKAPPPGPTHRERPESLCMNIRAPLYSPHPARGEAHGLRLSWRTASRVLLGCPARPRNCHSLIPAGKKRRKPPRSNRVRVSGGGIPCAGPPELHCQSSFPTSEALIPGAQNCPKWLVPTLAFGQIAHTLPIWQSDNLGLAI